MIEIFDRRKPNTVLITLIPQGGVFIADTEGDTLVLGCVISPDNICSKINPKGTIAYYVLNGVNAGCIRFRGLNSKVEPVSLRAVLGTFTE